MREEEEEGADVFEGVIRSVLCAVGAVGGTALISVFVSAFPRSDLSIL